MYPSKTQRNVSIWVMICPRHMLIYPWQIFLLLLRTALLCVCVCVWVCVCLSIFNTLLVAQAVKASAYNAGDLGSIPGLGRSLGEGNDNALQYSCLENPMDGGSW